MWRLVLLLAFSSAIFAAEIPVAEPGIVPGDARTYKRFNAYVAGGEEGFLVTWEERTFGIHPGPILIRAYDANGVPRRPIATYIDIGRNALAVWTGSEYLLVYARLISRFGSPVPVPVILALRVRADGTIVMDFSTVGMARAAADSSGRREVKIGR